MVGRSKNKVRKAYINKHVSLASLAAMLQFFIASLGMIMPHPSKLIARNFERQSCRTITPPTERNQWAFSNQDHTKRA